jgi:formate hydrogenlyase subunit 3
MNPSILQPSSLLALALVCYALSGALSWLLAGCGKTVAWVNGLGTMLGAAACTCSAWQILFSPLPVAQTLPWLNYQVELSQLNGWLLLAISIPAFFTGLYSLSWMVSAPGKQRRRTGLAGSLLLAAMTGAIVADNGVAWVLSIEIASLSAFFLIAQTNDAKSRRAALNQFLFGRATTLLLIVAFALLYHHTGSINFAALRTATLPEWVKTVAFLLSLAGFAMLAGIIPLHGWVPQSHSSAPAHIAALFSSALMKIGILGIVKISLDLLGVPPLWWGILVLVLSALTAFIGGLYALMEHDIRRLLAYHTLENIGIILLGIGGAMVGVAINSPLLASLALIGGLFHLLNHGFFKTTLFLGAGEIERQTGIKDMEKLGGLARLMPWTTIAVLIALVSMAALPPLNGFASEWFIYQSLFQLSGSPLFITRLIGPLLAVGLAITGALAVMCVAKVFGVTFLGSARSQQAERATHAPWSMTLSSCLQAALCLLCGIGSPWLLPHLATLCASVLNSQAIVAAHQGVMFPGASASTLVSPPLLAILLLALPVLPLLVAAICRGNRLPNRSRGDAWACGYGHSANMVVTATAFAQPLRVMFAPLYRLRKCLTPEGLVNRIHQGGLAEVCRLLALIELAILLVVSVA